jgi:hypothetical protein
MQGEHFLVVPWSVLKNLDTGRLGYLGTRASGTLTGEELQYAVYAAAEYLPEAAAQTGAYCWIGTRRPIDRVAAFSAGSRIRPPVPLAEVEVAYFVSDSRRREFLADLKVSGISADGLPFATLVLPGAGLQPAHGAVGQNALDDARRLNEELAYQERISAAIVCAASTDWWRARDLPRLRGQELEDRYRRLVTWARSCMGVVDERGRWSRTSVEQVIAALETAGLGDQVGVYRSYAEGNQWPVTENSLIATSMLALVRTEGGTADSLVNQLLAVSGIALPQEYSLTDVLIYLSVALGRHNLPANWKPSLDLEATLVQSEIEHAVAAFASADALRPVPRGSTGSAPEPSQEADLFPPAKVRTPRMKKKVEKASAQAVPTETESPEPVKFEQAELDRYLQSDSQPPAQDEPGSH